MHPGADPLGGQSSFSARRPNASNLPNFELPPPTLPQLQKYGLAPYNSTQSSAAPTSVASVGNLLTPPSNISQDSLSPISSGVGSNGSNSTQGVPPYTPGYAWQQPTQNNSPYGFQQGPAQQLVDTQRLFSPSYPQQVRNSAGSPTGTDGLPPPPFQINSNLPPFAASMPMSAPAIPTHQQAISNALMGGHPQTTSSAHTSPIHAHEAFRPPPTPTYYNNGGQQSGTPQQQHFPYGGGPSPTMQSPQSAMSRMSPANASGPVPALPSAQYAHQRPSYGNYPGLPGPVLSNVGNPGGQIAMVGGMPPAMMPFNSGHAANMSHIYGPPQPHTAPPNDRPFKCDQCPQSFNRNHDLKRHKRIHLAVKPFPCGHCEKSFSRKDALKRHILVKGCGKASASSADKQDGSDSAGEKSDGAVNSPDLPDRPTSA